MWATYDILKEHKSKVGVQNKTRVIALERFDGADDACSALWRVGRMSIDGRDIRLEVCFAEKRTSLEPRQSGVTAQESIVLGMQV